MQTNVNFIWQIVIKINLFIKIYSYNLVFGRAVFIQES